MFECDFQKAIANYDKHGIPFEEATTVFSDANGLDGQDVDHSEHEHHRLRIAKSVAGRILFVAYTMRRTDNEKETIRIISASQASRKERPAYSRFSD